jgi:hypothetical protein
MKSYHKKPTGILLATVFAAAMFASQSQAKGLMSLEGTISDAKLDGDMFSFFFTGRIHLEFATVPRSKKKEMVVWYVEKVPVAAKKWSNPYESLDDNTAVTFSNCVRRATLRAKDGKKTKLGIDGPKLSFSEADDLLIIEAVQISVGPPHD